MKTFIVAVALAFLRWEETVHARLRNVQPELANTKTALAGIKILLDLGGQQTPGQQTLTLCPPRANYAQAAADNR